MDDLFVLSSMSIRTGVETMKKTGHLILSDGTIFPGTFFGHQEKVDGELVFSTASTGYTEILSDPSFYGQIVVLSNPEVGNYGVNLSDMQSSGIKVRALVVKNLSRRASSFRSDLTLFDWCMRENLPIMTGIDTRALIARIRDQGAMMAMLTQHGRDAVPALLEELRGQPTMVGQRLSLKVAVSKPVVVKESLHSIAGETEERRQNSYNVVALDFGVKKELLRYLYSYGCDITLLPPDASIEDIWSYKPNGLFLSNGPGDPKTETRAVQTVKGLIGKVPIFGVCLGHQILGQALGMSTYKLKFGHRGSNQAVKLPDGRAIMTAQNHGFALKTDERALGLNASLNLSDLSNEGLEVPELGIFSVQYHPEGAPGPKDAIDCFEKFINYMHDWKKKSEAVSSLSSKTSRDISGRKDFVEGWDTAR